MSKSKQEAIQEVVHANHILYLKKIVDGFGHVSVRNPENPNTYLLSCNRAPNLVRREDIVELDLDSKPVQDEGKRLYLERFIHGELYKARPDVQAIVHSHSSAMITLAATPVMPKPLFHMAGFLSRLAKFDIAEATGRDTDMLIRDPELGRHLAESLGPANAVLMVGHGSTVVGGSIEETIYRAIYGEINAAMQIQALGISADIRYLTETEGKLADETNRGQLRRCWDLWVAEVSE